MIRTPHRARLSLDVRAEAAPLKAPFRISGHVFDHVSLALVTLRDRKDPRQKKSNDQRIPLLSVCGYDAMALIEEQRTIRSNEDDRIFSYNHRSVGTAFRRACQDLEIEDLHFHDLRHEGTSRLFEAGFSIQHVALVTGHKDWKMLRRYTHLKPESLHTFAASRVA